MLSVFNTQPAVSLAMFALKALVHSQYRAIGFVADCMYGDLQPCGVAVFDVCPHLRRVNKLGARDAACVRRIQIWFKEQRSCRSK